ncbi:MAG: hypothetical protein ACOYXC_21555 [Candidatus Rifleibacteriota bacterium]
MKFRAILTLALLVFCSAAAYSASMLPLIPQDSYLVINFDLPSIVKQPEIKALIDEKMQTAGNDYSDFYKRAGIEPAKDIHNVTIFLTNAQKSGIIVNGSFDTAKISELIQADKEISAKFQVSEIDGLQAVKNSKNANANMVFIDKNTLAFGPEDVLTQISQVQKGKAAGIEKDQGFANLMSKVDTSANMWGAVMAGPNWAEKTQVPVTGLQKMKSGFFSVDYDKEFILVFTGLVEKAAELPEFIQGMQNFLDAFKGWTASVPEFTQLLNKASVQDDKESMARIVVAVPAQEFKDSMNKLSDRLTKEETKK